MLEDGAQDQGRVHPAQWRVFRKAPQQPQPLHVTAKAVLTLMGHH
ncbi:hypothetical protein [Streptomyces sp. NBC_01092]|nr:hypothetical protein OG254_48815 [Streptomyces sp. NBC_01092]